MAATLGLSRSHEPVVAAATAAAAAAAVVVAVDCAGLVSSTSLSLSSPLREAFRSLWSWRWGWEEEDEEGGGV